jgi:hypothetical protein
VQLKGRCSRRKERTKFKIVQDAAIKCDDFEIAVLMNWVEYKKQKITEYQQ